MDQQPALAELLLAEVGQMALAGAAQDRITELVGATVAGWADEPDMNADAARLQVEQAWDSLSKDAADLQEAVADADGTDQQGLAGAKRTLAALQAAVAALAAMHERL